MAFWENSLFSNIISIFFGAAVATFFFFLQKIRVKLVYTTISTTLAQCCKDIPDLILTYNGRQTNVLYRTQITFHNTGNQKIEPSDFANADPLQICTEGMFFDDGKPIIIETNHSESSLSAQIIENKAIIIQFDYIRPKQNFTLSFLHNEPFYVSGTLKTGQIRNYTQRSNLGLKANLFNYFALLISIFGIAVAIFLVVYS